MATRLVFTGKQNVQSESFDPGKPGDDEILLRNVCTLMSTGTENIVFNRLFDPGTHWDRRTGRFNVDGLNTHTFDPSQPLEAYRVANEDRGNTMGILFNWRAS